ncbi:Hypothetical predicted protein, partial [Pelobates cultripes]
MLNRKIKVTMVAELPYIICEKITEARRDLSVLEQWVDDLEADRLHTTQYQQASDLATT